MIPLVIYSDRAGGGGFRPVSNFGTLLVLPRGKFFGKSKVRSKVSAKVPY